MDRVFLRYIESARFHLAITTDVFLRRLKNKNMPLKKYTQV